MKTFLSLIIGLGLFCSSHAAQTNEPPAVTEPFYDTHPLYFTNSFHAPAGSLEIVLNMREKFVHGTNADTFYDEVRFGTNANPSITMKVTFRNVGEVKIENINYPDLLYGSTVIWDGKEYRYDREFTGWFGSNGFDPKTAWQQNISLSDYPIPKEELASGRHTISVKSLGIESNRQTIFIDPHKWP
jgi:hypothetical protein